MSFRKQICLIIPSMGAGGAERVMSELATFFSQKEETDVHLLLLVKTEHFFKMPDQVKIYEPDFDYRKYSRPVFMVKNIAYLRKTLKKIYPDVALSFGGKYNAFVLLASMGTQIPVFISDRSRPSISYGTFLDVLNKWVYPKAAGIVAQTKTAREKSFQQTGHQKIQVIGNPVRPIAGEAQPTNMILNVGRFIPSKKQEVLLDIFARINPPDWTLCFVGDGERLEAAKQKAKDLGISSKVVFAGRQKNVDAYLQKASIFAFTSVSEGFPNALAEGMNTPLPCISFDIEAGPADLIDDGENGFLIQEGDTLEYERRLKQLIDDAYLRNRFRKAAQLKIEQFKLSSIGEQYYQFLIT